MFIIKIVILVILIILFARIIKYMNFKVSVNLNIQVASFLLKNFIGKFEWGPLWNP